MRIAVRKSMEEADRKQSTTASLHISKQTEAGSSLATSSIAKHVHSHISLSTPLPNHQSPLGSATTVLEAAQQSQVLTLTWQQTSSQIFVDAQAEASLEAAQRDLHTLTPSRPPSPIPISSCLTTKMDSRQPNTADVARQLAYNRVPTEPFFRWMQNTDYRYPYNRALLHKSAPFPLPPPRPMTDAEKNVIERLVRTLHGYTREPITEFGAYFKKLPPEIRCMIWELSMPGQRVVTIQYYHGGYHSPCGIPAQLHTCQEARHIALRQYTLSFGTACASAKLYFNPSRDVVYLDRDDFTPAPAISLKRRMAMKANAFAQRVKLPAFKTVTEAASTPDKSHLFRIHFNAFIHDIGQDRMKIEKLVIDERGWPDLRGSPNEWATSLRALTSLQIIGTSCGVICLCSSRIHAFELYDSGFPVRYKPGWKSGLKRLKKAMQEVAAQPTTCKWKPPREVVMVAARPS